MVPEDVRKHLHRRFPDQEEDDEAEGIYDTEFLVFDANAYSAG